ncbi:Protein NLRC5 [Cricetulus griseus]|uniref:Protein NLRC5 n=1 Tax=Cricetulus griseus TaxID=10029 RepID=G3HIK5_CRIGR|nr:Protein NLRC5 [Cricetulus griseus]ERE79193.1 nucleotide-binding oligomerization domain-containing protein 2 [Cricetulus griseus]
MDSESFQLGTENLWAWLVRLLSKNSEWLNGKIRFYLPTMDLDCSNTAPEPEVIHHQIRRLYTQDQATWQSFINSLCMELDVPLELEVPLLSIWGQKDGVKRPSQSCGSSPRRKHCRKQQLELAKKYLKLLKTSARRYHGGECPGAGHTHASPQAYIPPILQWSRATAPLDAQEGATIGDPDTADDIDVSIQDLFNFKAPKGPRVTVLLGKAGMGKTTLAHRLCWRWADGQLDRFQALFLFEFRRLNMITHLLTLPQLLFDLYLRPESDPDAVFQYLEENAHQVLLIFDGLDEALHADSVGADNAGSALNLFSDLCRGTLLPGCWVMATSRPGKLPACVPTEAAMVYMWGFDGLRVEKYISHFFSDLLSQELALAELRTNERLWGMCAVPALCQVACFCLRHLLPRSPPGQCAALLPTVTQLYLQMVETFSHNGILPATSLLSLGKVAFGGLDTGKVIFSMEDIPPPLMAFGAVHGLLTSFCIRTSPEHQETGYAFAHLSLQEFFAALYLMASDTIDKDTVTYYVTLNSHWVLRTKSRLGLSDHLPTFLAGLASHTCHAFLCHLTQQDEAWVGSRQAAVVQVLRKLASRKLTGPKMIELYHCVAETQELELARFIAQSLPFRLSFHNFPLTHADLAALANVLEHRAAPIHLDFDGCPLEPRCPEALVGCGQVENLSFKSRKCGDAFAEALGRSLPTMGSLKMLGLTGSKITARGISHLVQALPLCSQLEELSLHDNQLKDPEVLSLVKLLPCLSKLQKLDLSRNSFSVSTLLSSVKVAITCSAVRKLQVRALNLQDEDSLKKEGQSRSLELRLQKCHLRVHDAEALVELFQKGPRLEEVDLSGNHLDDEGCRLVAEAASQLQIAQKLDLSDNGLSKTGVTYVLRAVNTCGTLEELHISLQNNIVVLTFAQEPRKQERNCKGGVPLTSFASPVASETSRSSRSISLSDNSLGDEGVALLAQLLPGLGPLQSLNLSRNGVSLDAVFDLTTCMSSVQWVFHLDVSLESEHILLQGAGTGRLQGCQMEPLSLARLCATLEKCPGPLEVHLSCKTLSDESLKTLLQCLPQLPQLRLLQLSHTVLSSRSPFLLADVFNLCPGVQKVNLRSLCHAVLHFDSKKEKEGVCFGLSHNSISQEGVLCILETLPSCPRVCEVSVSLGSEQNFRICLSREKEVGTKLRMCECNLGPEYVSRLASSLSQAQQLTELTLTRCHLDLPQLTNLLNLVNRPAGLLGLRLEEPWVGHVGLLAVMEVCAQASGCLTELSLSETQKQLWLRLEFPHQEDSSEFMANSLSQVNFSDEDNKRSRLLQNLLMSSSELKSFRLGNNALGDPTALGLAQRLPPQLRVLCLPSSHLGPEGALCLAQALEQCPCIEEFSLAENNLAGNVPHFCKSLPLLRHIDLISCKIDDQAAKHLATSLMLCPALEEISLSWNLLGDEVAAELAQVLPQMEQLKRVDLEKNRITACGAQLLAQGLVQGSCVPVIRLWNNPIPADVAQSLQRQEPRLDFAFFDQQPQTL